ncbi:Fc.00g081850.m01.CDS01 [Cosmosporella sp. VM-42]
MPPVSIEAQVTIGQTKKHGLVNAYCDELFKFLQNAKHGISLYGKDLGQYYREFYPNLRPWIEYFVLLHDLPRPDEPSGSDSLCDRFCQAVVLLALSSMAYDDPAVVGIQRLNSSQVINLLREALRLESSTLDRKPCSRLAWVALVRFVLVQVGGPDDIIQRNMLDFDYRENAVRSDFATLLGSERPSMPTMHIRSLVETLSRCRVFSTVSVDENLVTELMGKYQALFDPSDLHVPQKWVADLPSCLPREMRFFFNETLSICPSLRLVRNGRSIYLVWAYLCKQTFLLPWSRVALELDDIFTAANASISRPQTVAQLSLDLMVMVCISRSYPANKPHLYKDTSVIDEFDSLLQGNGCAGATYVLNRMIISLHRVLSAEDFSHRNARLAQFIGSIGVPKHLLELHDTHSDLYWVDRIADPVGHAVAFENVCRVVVNFPVQLAPIK